MTNQDLLEPILTVDDIQGNILGGFNKDHQGIIALSFTEDDATVAAVRQWLARFVQRVTPLSEVLPFKHEFKRRKMLEGAEPADMVSLWRNIAFSYPGLRKLTPQAEAFTDYIFRNGLPAASQRLGDPLTPGTPGEKNGWVVGKPGEIPDILLIIAGDNPDAVEDEVKAVIEEAQQHKITCSHYDIGHDLSHYNNETLHYDHGHEHFGFEDGISQPGVRGRLSEKANDFLTPRTTASSDDLTQPEWGAPGQPLVGVGQFVLGYGKQNATFPRLANPPDTLGPQPYAPDSQAVAPYWAHNGSYLVYRRLRQDVASFNRFLEFTVQQLAQSPGFATTVERLGALLVGRWKSGAPLMRAPGGDNPPLGKSAPANNAFAYGGALADPQDGFPFIPDDRTGTVCPFTAHIRKVNPRDVTTEQIGSPAETLTRRILRRGIPFGPPLPPGATNDPAKEERGLLFLSYQASINKQFEFLCQQWMNHSEFPAGSQGFDMILGQINPKRVRTCLLGSSAQQTSISTQNFDPKDWIIPTGGGYFFAPSLSALREVLCNSR